MREIAQAIGQELGVSVRSMTKEEAAAHFGWTAPFVAIDNPICSAITRNIMGRQPLQAGLLADMQSSGYF